jgi:hypothetical protein
LISGVREMTYHNGDAQRGDRKWTNSEKESEKRPSVLRDANGRVHDMGHNPEIGSDLQEISADLHDIILCDLVEEEACK